MSKESTTTAKTAAAPAGRLAALIAAAIVCVRSAPDPDFWGHLRFGLDLATSGRLPSVDPYSFTQDVPWVNHEWLSEWLFAQAYRAGGVAGLMTLKMAIVGLAFWLLARLGESTRQEYRGWLLAVAFVGCAPLASTFRPHLWTVLGLAIVSTILAGRARIAWLPLIFVAWANLHGGWIVGVGVCGLWLAGRVIDTRTWRPVVMPAAVVAFSVVATIANPYGWRLWQFLADTVGMSRPDITEWRPYWEAFEPAQIVLLPLTIGILATTITARWRHVSWARLLPACWLGLNALFVARLAPLFSFMACVCVLEAWRRDGAEPTASAAGVQPRLASTQLIDAVTVLAVTVPLFLPQARCLEIPAAWRPDPIAASALSAPEVRGRIVVPFDWGEYAIWHWGPRLQVSTDGRRETVYSAATLEEQQLVALGRPDVLEAFVSRTNPDYAWLRGRSGDAAAMWFAHHGYTVDIDTGASVVLRRQDRAPLRAGLPASSCAP
ncbi:MAG: hypothetical protein ABL961_00350 [Vicinamibacterales bacterium]